MILFVEGYRPIDGELKTRHRHISMVNCNPGFTSWSDHQTIEKMWQCEVILDLHFVIQKEQSTIDRIFTKMGISGADTYIVHALKTFEELKPFILPGNFT